MMIIFHTVILIPTCREKDLLFRSNPVTPSLRLPAGRQEGGTRSTHEPGTYPTEAICLKPIPLLKQSL